MNPPFFNFNWNATSVASNCPFESFIGSVAHYLKPCSKNRHRKKIKLIVWKMWREKNDSPELCLDVGPEQFSHSWSWFLARLALSSNLLFKAHTPSELLYLCHCANQSLTMLRRSVSVSTNASVQAHAAEAAAMIILAQQLYSKIVLDKKIWC